MGGRKRERERDGEKKGERDVEVINHIPFSKIPHNYWHQVAEGVYLWQGRWQIAAALFTQLTVALCLLQRARRFWFPVKNNGSENIYILVKAAFAPQSVFTVPANLRRDAITKGHPEPF